MKRTHKNGAVHTYAKLYCHEIFEHWGKRKVSKGGENIFHTTNQESRPLNSHTGG